MLLMFSHLSFLYTLIILGVLCLFLSLKPAYQIISDLSSGTTKIRWKVLFGLILIFIIGYLTILIFLTNMPAILITDIVVYILFGGGIFVWILCNLSVDTISMAKHITKLENENIQDPLMGIYNRRHLDCRLVEEFKRARRHAQPLTYLMLDVDHFKKINDTFGHDVGDQVLIRLAEILKQHTRGTDILARYGGEEIGIILPLTNAAEGELFAERIRKKVDEELAVSLTEKQVVNGLNMEGDVHNITVSIGVACINDQIVDTHDFMKQADKALYQAKNKGRNCVVVQNWFEPIAIDFKAKNIGSAGMQQI